MKTLEHKSVLTRKSFEFQPCEVVLEFQKRIALWKNEPPIRIFGASHSNVCILFGRGPNRVIELLVLTQKCNRHAIRANVNKASKQAKRGECLPCERLVQGRTHVGKKALLAGYVILLLRSQTLIRIFSIFTSSNFGSLKSEDEMC